MEIKCENCYWYRWEDSVWGYCWRFPPKEIMTKWFPKIKYKMERPEVCFNEFACGEFLAKKGQKLKKIE